jgi:hypothetical protein
VSKIWFCRNCGYEVTSRGRCHACKARLSSSPLPELPAGNEDEEVGYRLQDWSDGNRARLIVRLIEANVTHRFDDNDELVVGVEDESRTDDLVEEIASGADVEDILATGDEVDDPVRDAADEEVLAQVETLLVAARRLRENPTDMQADGDLALASGSVFIAEGFYGTDDETWAAIGRVTRRLLGALGAEEALEDEIRLQASILVKLLEPLVAADVDPYGPPPASIEDGVLDGRASAVIEAGLGPTGVVALEGDPPAEIVEGASPGGPAAEIGEAESPVGSTVEIRATATAGGVAADGAEVADGAEGVEAVGGVEVVDGVEAVGGAEMDEPEAETGESVYELPEWLPEQRAQLSLHLDEASIPHAWEGGDLVVSVAVEAEVEALFERIDGVNGDEDDEARYRTLEALFAAADRFVNDPDSRPKRLEVVRAVAEAEGPTPLGLDDAQWWSIRSRARLLADSIEHDASLEVVFGEATVLRDMLRILV